MRLGISSYTFPWSFGVPHYPQPKKTLDATGLLRSAKLLGVEVVQICDNYPLHKVTTDVLDEILAMSK
ncbi:MAG: hypothetical protein N3E47_05795, partial [Candidatus Bathyarchaeota archaeon]|nr:hypothetical protein [Candidatus Bathyarchaeota archaeon]